MNSIISSRIPVEKYIKLKDILKKLDLTNTEFLNKLIDIFITKYDEKYCVNTRLHDVNKTENDVTYQNIRAEIDEFLDGLLKPY